MNIEQLLTDAVVKAVKACYGADITPEQVQIQKTRPDFEGHLTVVTFPFLRISKRKPEDTGEDLALWLVENTDLVSTFNIVKGFLNLTIAPKKWIELLENIDADQRYGLATPGDESPLTMVEYSSPNTNKPLHLGHVRNNLLGWAVSKIAEANGSRVVKTNIVNDRGIHICKSMLAWQKYGNGDTPESTGKKGDHLVGDYYVAFDQHYRAEVAELKARLEAEGVAAEEAETRAKNEAPLMVEAREMLRKWEQGDEEVRALWRKMNEWVYAGFDETYKALGVSFDKIYYESETYLEGKEKVEEGLEKGLFYRREDGSVWADLTQDGLDEKLLLRSDGTSVYMTQDIGTAKLRFRDYPIDKMVYVVGNEQNYHFQVLSLLLDRLGFEWGKSLVHFSYGMVELPNGKMKSREGTEESIDFNGNTGPFIQYTYARIRSILRKAQEAGLEITAVDPATEISVKEEEIIQRIADFTAVVRAAGQDYSPSAIANYCYELVKDYNQFYHEFQILREEDAAKRNFRLVLSRNVAKVVRLGMELLGIEMPERM